MCLFVLSSSCYLSLVDLNCPWSRRKLSSQLKFPDCESNLQKGGQLRRKTVILGASKSFKLYVFATKVTSKAEKCIISSNLHANGQ